MTRTLKIIDLRRQGLTYRAIGERLGLTRQQVSGVLHREGLTDPNSSNAAAGRANRRASA